MRDYEALIAAARESMMQKLKENTHKTSWEVYSLLDLYHLMAIEMLELKEAIQTGVTIDIQMEAADVANYAAMIIHNCSVNRGGESGRKS
jgi:NTP pyrophosphatase (non-canonical NTP hydrolase)